MDPDIIPIGVIRVKIEEYDRDEGLTSAGSSGTLPWVHDRFLMDAGKSLYWSQGSL